MIDSTLSRSFPEAPCPSIVFAISSAFFEILLLVIQSTNPCPALNL